MINMLSEKYVRTNQCIREINSAISKAIDYLILDTTTQEQRSVYREYIDAAITQRRGYFKTLSEIQH